MDGRGKRSLLPPMNRRVSDADRMSSTNRFTVHAQLVGPRTAAAREDVGLTQVQRAERINVSRLVVAALEGGRGTRRWATSSRSAMLCRLASTPDFHYCRLKHAQLGSSLPERPRPMPRLRNRQSLSTCRGRSALFKWPASFRPEQVPLALRPVPLARDR